MPKQGQCSVCLHRRVAAINSAVVSGKLPLRKIAVKFGVGQGSLYRHRHKCIEAKIQKYQKETDFEDAKGIILGLRELRQFAGKVRSRAATKKDGDLELKALARMQSIDELTARLLGLPLAADRDGLQTKIEVIYIDKQMNVAAGAIPLPPRSLPAPQEGR
jgi:hypothetical protein